MTIAFVFIIFCYGSGRHPLQSYTLHKLTLNLKLPVFNQIKRQQHLHAESLRDANSKITALLPYLLRRKPISHQSIADDQNVGSISSNKIKLNIRYFFQYFNIFFSITKRTGCFTKNGYQKIVHFQLSYIFEILYQSIMDHFDSHHPCYFKQHHTILIHFLI